MVVLWGKHQRVCWRRMIQRWIFGFPTKHSGFSDRKHPIINRLRHVVSSEYAQPLVSGVTTLGARSTFKPDEGPDPGYSDPDLYDAPISPDVYHAYAEPLPASRSEYATPIIVDMGCHPVGGATLNQPAAVCGLMGAGLNALLTRTEGSQKGRSAYDTPKNTTGQASEDLTYQVPQSCTQKTTEQGWRVGTHTAFYSPVTAHKTGTGTGGCWRTKKSSMNTTLVLESSGDVSP